MSTKRDERDVQAALAEPAFWPNLSQAAGIVGLTKGTLSKQAHAGHIEYRVLGLGRGLLVLPPAEILRLGNRYQRVPAATLVARLSDFFAPRLCADSEVMQRVLRHILDGVVSCGTTKSVDQTGGVGVQEERRPMSNSAPEAPPAWFSEVEELRANPVALAGAVTFVSHDETVGRIRLGQPIDDMPAPGSSNWEVA